MLPAPISFPKRRDSFHRNRSGKLNAALRAPSRLTNLGVLLLTSLALFSLLLNLRHYFFSFDIGHAKTCGEYFEDAQSVERPASISNLKHLIIVPGHGIWTGAHEREILDEDSWVLASYQRGRGRPALIAEHIAQGAELTLQDKESLLVFSGGQTSPLSSTTEAESYHRLALAALYLPHKNATGEPFQRVTTEPFALDSYQNLLFSVARFREYTGGYPQKITVVGYEFKRRRFEELHRTAVRWPSAEFEYIGLSLHNQAEEDKASAGENSYLPYTDDLYGCRPPLSTKRRSRNPHLRVHAYHRSAPELRNLFEWCPSSTVSIFRGPLPWDAR
ncbi:hypothetical protein EVG20_g1394 [Dentipellis fragilis]|uniref:DUF218 domain-containing protein n=1 Tax=Dentipellis fragilis TaxID=205917 RepID=A0A4Y9ZCB4_9AGAM|nr:hypothetical protein EVG20_g1394 [Dentipellis fragilis]